MKQIQKLFSIAMLVIRAGEIVINLPSKLFAGDYFGAARDAAALIAICWAQRDVLKKIGGHILSLSKTAIRHITVRSKSNSAQRKDEISKHD